MSYTPTTWTNGDTITAEKLNKMEQGIAGAGAGGFIVHWDSTNNQSVETTGEIAEAIAAGRTVVLDTAETSGTFVSFYYLQRAEMVSSSGTGQYLDTTFSGNLLEGEYPDGYLHYVD